MTDDLVKRLRHHFHLLREAADTITTLRAQLAEAEADGREATRLLVLWSETDGAEDATPGHDTFAFLGKENSAGWVWAREVREERDFDAEQQRIRDLAMQAVIAAEENARAAESSLARARKALVEEEEILIAEYHSGRLNGNVRIRASFARLRATLQPDGDNATGYEKCPACDGSGLALNMAGERMD